MKGGRWKISPIFEKRRFWPPILWVLALAFGVALGCIFRSPEIIVAAVMVAFLGLNETSRWAYKTNLMICTAAAVVGTLAGVFPWSRAGFIFILLFVVCGYMLYFRDATRRLLPYFEEFTADLSACKDLEETTALAVDIIGAMSGGEAVFIAISDREGGLYLPDYHDDKRINLKRDGGSVWKVFASGRSFVTSRLELSKDLPLDRDARSLMSVPLLLRGEKLGVLQLESDHLNAFSDYDLSKLEMLAFIVSHAIYFHLSTSSPEPDEIVSDVDKVAKRAHTHTDKSPEDSAQTKLNLVMETERQQA